MSCLCYHLLYTQTAQGSLTTCQEFADNIVFVQIAHSLKHGKKTHDEDCHPSLQGWRWSDRPAQEHIIICSSGKKSGMLITCVQPSKGTLIWIIDEAANPN